MTERLSYEKKVIYTKVYSAWCTQHDARHIDMIIFRSIKKMGEL
jgi:hypothetical protein